jgi:hypothetical protein
MGANAQTSVPAFTSGQVLTAAEMTQVNTGIPVFASSIERDAAFGGAGEKTLAEGQMAYLEDTNATQYYDGSAWAAVAGGKILQVVSTTKTDTWSASIPIGSSAAVTGLTVDIAPSSTSNKVLIQVMLSSASALGDRSGVILTRGGSAISGAIADADGLRGQVTGGITDREIDPNTSTFVYLDSPASTSTCSQ